MNRIARRAMRTGTAGYGNSRTPLGQCDSSRKPSLDAISLRLMVDCSNLDGACLNIAAIVSVRRSSDEPNYSYISSKFSIAMLYV